MPTTTRRVNPQTRWEGTVCGGVKNASVWLDKFASHYEKNVGFRPFPGTLNVQLPVGVNLKINEVLEHAGGADSVPGYIFMPGREYGGERDIMMLRCTVLGVCCCIWRTTNAEQHESNTIELISATCLRDALRLSDGDLIPVDLSQALVAAPLPPLTLVSANHNYSSWSARAWAFMACSGVPFSLKRVSIFSDSDWRAEVRQYSPTGKLPALIVGADDSTVQCPHCRLRPLEPTDRLVVYDSLAIVEWCVETLVPLGFDNVPSWPETVSARARTRCGVFELHSGFLLLRDEFPFNVRRLSGAPDSAAEDPPKLDRVAADVRRVRELLELLAPTSRGLWMNDRPKVGIADCFFGVEAMRLGMYGIEAAESDKVADWILAFQLLPEMAALGRFASAETDVIEPFEWSVGKDTTPLHLLSHGAKREQQEGA